MRDCSASACRIAWRIHHTAYEMNDAFRLVELVSRADEAEVALVDQIRKRHALVLIFLRHGHDEAQVRPDQLVERLLIGLADTLGEADLFVAADQWVGTDVAQILVERPFLVGSLLRGSGGHTTSGSFGVSHLPPRLRALRERSAGLFMSRPEVNGRAPDARPTDPGEPRHAIQRIRIVTVVNEHRTPADERVRNELPVATVERVVPIIPEDEVLVWGDDQRTPIVSRWRRACSLGGPHEVLLLPLEVDRDGVRLRLAVRHVAVLILTQAVHIQVAEFHFERIARDADEPLDEILRRIHGPLKHDHVAPLRMTDRRQMLPVNGTSARRPACSRAGSRPRAASSPCCRSES